MKASGNIIRDHGILDSVPTWKSLKEWASGHITQGRLVDCILTVGTIGMVGTVYFVLHQAYQGFTMTGF